MENILGTSLLISLNIVSKVICFANTGAYDLYIYHLNYEEYSYLYDYNNLNKQL